MRITSALAASSRNNFSRSPMPFARTTPTRPVIHDGDEDLNGLAKTFNWHYPEGYEQLPKGSIYSWVSKVQASKPTGIGEFLACPWVEKIKPDVFWWHGTWSRACAM